MRRLRMVFAIFLLLLALPIWRFLDILAIVSPFQILLTFGLTLTFALFILVPLKLFSSKLKTWMLILIIPLFALVAFNIAPLSSSSSLDPALNHCGHLTFTGSFYPLRKLLTEAYRDDLEARNQLCWIRKMISEVPKFSDKQNFEKFVLLNQTKLLKPEIKYRSSLPLIAALNIAVFNSYPDLTEAKGIYDSLHFWINHYTDEISARDYPWWNFPHSVWIKFEYGIVEENWQKLIDNIVIQEN